MQSPEEVISTVSIHRQQLTAQFIAKTMPYIRWDEMQSLEKDIVELMLGDLYRDAYDAGVKKGMREGLDAMQYVNDFHLRMREYVKNDSTGKV